MSSALIASAVRPSENVRLTRQHPFVHTLKIAGSFLVVSVVALFLTGHDYRYLLAPILAMATIAVVHISLLSERDGVLPVFEIGTIWLLGTLVYSIVPFVGFLAAGVQWPASADGRLLAYQFDAEEIGLYAWRHVVYIAAFCFPYLAFRGVRVTRLPSLPRVGSSLVVSLVVLLALEYSFKWAMYFAYGLDLDISYTAIAEQLAVSASIPYLLLQITLVVLASMLVVKLALLIVLIQRRSSVKARAMLMAWLAVEVLAVLVRGGQRGSAVLLLLGCGLLYHRFVRPLRPAAIAVGGATLLAGFLLLGIARDAVVNDSGAALTEVRPLDLLTSQNEFQSVFATSYDISQRKQAGALGDVPLQLYFVDLYLEIPSQVLPFEKVDPAQWYLDLIGLRNSGVGFMFGVMSQAAVGFGWIELVLRGVLLGTLFAAFHRWYVRNASRFWATVLYLFVTIWSYYTFRATTFWFVHSIVYQFVPVMLAAMLIEAMASRAAPPVARQRVRT